MMNFTDLPDEVITRRLMAIVTEDRKSLVDLLEGLAELERRRTILALGFSSTFSYCTEHLRLSNGSAFRRSKGARLLARFPIVADYLRDGRLSLAKLVELREVLHESNVVEIVERAVEMTEERVKELAAELRPKAPPPPLFRRLPTPRNDSSGSAVEPAPALFAHTAVTAPLPTPPVPSVPAVPARVATSSPGRLEPIAADRHVLRVTVDGAFVADLQAVRQALSHKMPGAALEAVLHECIRTTLRQIEKRRQGAGRRRRRRRRRRGARSCRLPFARRCGSAMGGSART